MFHPNSKVSLSEKIELYFNDFEFSSLMIQENYLKPNPDFARNAGNVKEQKFKALELAEKASESISNADLVDAMIHGYLPHNSKIPEQGRRADVEIPTTMVLDAYACRIFLCHPLILHARLLVRTIQLHFMAGKQFETRQVNASPARDSRTYAPAYFRGQK